MWDALRKNVSVTGSAPPCDSWLYAVTNRCVAVTAGDGTGFFAKELAGWFDEVYVFESNRTNYCCSKLNTVCFYSVYVSPKALGCNLDIGSLINGRMIDDRMGHVHFTELDAIRLQALDVLIINRSQDIEQVIEGARGKIERFRPVIVIENSRITIPKYSRQLIGGQWTLHTMERIT